MNIHTPSPFHLCEIARRETNGIDPTYAQQYPEYAPLLTRGDWHENTPPCKAMMPEYRPHSAGADDNHALPDTVTVSPSMRASLRRSRLNAGLSQEELALAVGAYPGWVNQLEIGIVRTISRHRYNDLLDTCIDAMRAGVTGQVA